MVMELNEFLAFCGVECNIYIRIDGEKISTSIGTFIKEHPTNWGLYEVIDVRASNNDLIIEVKKYF